MPTYEYSCPQCGGFDAFRAMAVRNEPATCTQCGGAAPRVLASAPGLALMQGGTRRAIAANERASNEPKRSADYSRLKHSAGCGCCSASRRGATVTAPNGTKAFPSKRPWMISH